MTLECNTFDAEHHYVEWYRNDSRVAVIQQLEDYDPVVSTNYTARAELKKKDLHISHVKFEDAATYVCRTAIRREDDKAAIQHGTFWKLIVKHEGQCLKYLLSLLTHFAPRNDLDCFVIQFYCLALVEVFRN